MKPALALLVFLFLGHPTWAQSLPASQDKWAETATNARVSLSRNGPWLKTPADPGTMLEISDDTGTRPQFLESARGVTLILFVDRSALRKVLIDGVRLNPSTKIPAVIDDKTPGVFLEPGTVLDEVSHLANGLVRVKITELRPFPEWRSYPMDFELNGYVASATLGTVFSRRAAELPRPHFEADVTLPERFELLESPGGTAFTIWKGPGVQVLGTASGGRIKAQVLDRTGTHVLVRIQTGVVGWVESEQVKPLPAGEDHDGHFFGPIATSDGPSAGTLPLGTPLFDGVDGHFVGSADRDFVYPSVQDKAGWQRFDIPTDYGTIPVWSRPGAYTKWTGKWIAVPTGNKRPIPRDRTPSITLGQVTADGDLDKAIIRHFIKRNTQKILYCYEYAWSANPKLAGTVTASFTIGVDGRVSQSEAIGVAPDMAKCIASMIEEIEFPKPKGNEVKVRYPFVFSVVVNR